jgi:hypothetical protein
MSGEGQVDSQAGERLEGCAQISRRALLKAGWTAPVILTVAPAVAFALSGELVGPPAPGGGTTSHSAPTPSSPAQSGPAGQSGAGATSELPEQQSEGPQPARINRGFTG